MAEVDTVEGRLERIERKIDGLKKKKKEGVDYNVDENEDRGNWSGKFDFLLACLGYAVGLGNVWRFPYLCYKNGGGAFFIPYVIMLCFVGIPIFFLELSLGQYTSSGPLTCWKFAPVFTGIGAGMVIVSALVAIYYNMIIAWAIYYLFASFTTDLPWAYCGNWSSPLCAHNLNSSITTMAECMANVPMANYTNGVCYSDDVPFAIVNRTLAAEHNIKAILPAEEYLYGRVLGRNNVEGLHDLGELRWELCLCLLLAWVIVFFSLINGVKSSGKVVYFTAIFPYCVLIVFFIRACLLDGFADGVEFYLSPDLTRLQDAQVWKDAAVQIFFSLSASWGGLITLASYNRFHTNTLRDSLIVSLGNCLTSFFAGFAVFGFLGYLAKEMGQRIEDVATSGVGLAFVVYPEAILRIPVSTLWAILFFVMLITLGLDSEFALMETVMTAILDAWPDQRIRKKKGFVLLGICVLMYLFGLLLCTDAGVLLLELMDIYSGGWNVLLISALECFAVGWFYGFMKFRRDIAAMIGKNPFCLPWLGCSYWWGLCWCFITPLLVLAVMVFSLYQYKTPTFDDYMYPPWAEAVGWMMTLAVVAGIVITPLILLCKGEKNWITPRKDWGPALVRHRKLIHHLPNFEVDPWGNSDIKDVNGADNPGFVEDKTAL